jgi:hypothetical protein
MEFDAETAARSHQWLAGNPSEKHGKHSYSPERFGIDEAVIEEHFADYMRHFGL